MWDAIRKLTAWLNRDDPFDRAHSFSMRLLKLQEEMGEVAQAYIGWTGQNPRKGVTHTQDDLLDELADVAVTALVAMESLDPVNGEIAWNSRIEKLTDRIDWKSNP